MLRMIRQSLPRPVLLCVACAVALSGCGSKKAESEDVGPKISDIKPLEPTEANTNSVPALREQLNLNPGEGEIELVGGKIAKVDLERTRVSDITPLQGLPLEELYLSHTIVSDLSPLKGMKLKKLNVMGTRVTDISVVKTMDVNGLTLWLNDTKVKDISALKGKALESLDLTGTPVTDLSPLAGMKTLKRLNLERCAATDLTPLQGLQLQRIVFQPAKIKKGLDAVRNMKTLEKMHAKYQDKQKDWLKPDEFWKRAAAGTLPKE